jgi:hypothetical protein
VTADERPGSGDPPVDGDDRDTPVPEAAGEEPPLPVQPAAPGRVDPEDWSGSGEDDDRYLRERPPHWE